MKKLGFGLMRLPLTNPEDSSSIDLEQVKQMADALIERGFTYFDTAYFYHEKTSEEAVRKAVVERHPRDSFTLATKMPVSILTDREHQERIFAGQLEKCGVEYFDYYLLHCLSGPNYEKAKELDSFGLLQRAKAEERARQIGFSFHDRADVLDRILTDHPEVDFVQLQINYLDWENGGIQSRLCWETARKHGKPVIIMEPVKGGRLAKLSGEAEAILRQANPNRTPASWALRFAAGLEGVMVVLSGMSNMEQLRENMELFENLDPLSPEELKVLESAAAELNRSALVPCTACRYCVEGCPQHIPIPELFALFNEDMEQRSRWRENDARYEEITAGKGIARDCIACKHCEESCPQHIDVARRMKAVNWRFDR